MLIYWRATLRLECRNSVFLGYSGLWLTCSQVPAVGPGHPSSRRSESGGVPGRGLEAAPRRPLGAGVGWKDREGYVTDMFGKGGVWKVGGMYEWCWCIEGLGIFLGFWKFFFSGAASFDGFWWGFAIAVQSPSFPWLFRILEPSPRQYCGWFANYILYYSPNIMCFE